MHSPETPAPARAPRHLRFVVNGLRSLGFGVAIAVALSITFRFNFWYTLTNSVCIAVMCWFTIDSGRLLAARWVYRNAAPGAPPGEHHWPGWHWMLGIILIGTIVGFSAGSSIADWMTGRQSPGYLKGSLSDGVSLLMLSLIPGLAITYWFYSREAIASKEAAVQMAQRQAAEHQLKLLESQLEPHMLFNTLANLRVLIGTDPARAQAMLDQLIAFLRATLSGSRAAQHPLSAEFARLGDYLALMHIRMGDRLRSHFDLPEALADVRVPPLLLQPLVENCIKHGLEPAVAGGRVDVSAAREGPDLVLRVRDTGAGLSEAASDGTKFGLVQVRERLATLFGTRASLTLQAATDAEGGTLATIRLPLPETTPTPTP